MSSLSISDDFITPSTTIFTTSSAYGSSGATATISGISAYDAVGCTINVGANVTGGIVYFEIYDGANWVPIKGGRLEAYTGDQTFNLPSYPGIVKAWVFNTAPFSQFRVRLNTALTASSGNGSTTVTLFATSAPVDPSITVGLDTNTIASTYHLAGNSAATVTNNVKNSAGILYGWNISNTSASNPLHVRFYNSASATTVGSGTPIYSVLVPASGHSEVSLVAPINFSTGISYTVTAGLLDTDTTALAANVLSLNLSYT